MTPEEIKEAIEKLDNLWITSQNTEAQVFAYELLEKPAIQEDAESLAKVYNALGIASNNLSDYQKALEYYSKSLLLNEELENKSGIANNLGNFGYVYQSLSDYPIALEYYSKALQIYEEIGNKGGIANIFVFKAEVYRNLSDFPKALEYSSRALQIYEEIGNNFGVANSFIMFGNVYWHLSDFYKALEYQSKALQINEDIGNKNGIAINLSNIGSVYSSLSDFIKALEYFSKALQTYEEIGNNYGVAHNLSNIGNVYYNISDIPKAFEFFGKAFHIFEEIENKPGIAYSIGVIGRIFSTKESTFYDLYKAEEYLQKSLLLAEEIGAKEIILGVYEQLHSLRLNEKLFEDALAFFKKSVELKKEIQSEDAINKAQLFDQRRKIEEDEKVRQLKLARFQEQEKILHTILPVNIADRILNQETFIADYFESASVIFFDIVNFTQISSFIPPKQLVFLLDAIFQKADEVVENYGLEKIKTIGDGYLAVSNVTTPLEHHQKATALAALQLLETMKDFTVNIPTELGDTDWIKNMNDLKIRIGIHSGEVVAGIIGKNKYTYDLWGDAVNVASRMESNSEPGRIHISEQFARSIEIHNEFSIIPRGTISIKGKGTMNTYWLEKGK